MGKDDAGAKKMPQNVSAAIKSPHSDGAGQRSALLIGNQSYSWGPLETPQQDVSAIEERLRSIGFNIHKSNNSTQTEIYEAVDAFLRTQVNSEILLFFYAGHSIQLNGRNYLIPVDARIDDPDLLSKLFDLGYLLESLASEKNRTSIIILDACRSNPFSALPHASAGLSELIAPHNTFIAFSTAPGKTAEDGDSKHSPYTLGLLKYLFQPGVGIEEAFRSIRRYVRIATENRQIPWENTSLEYDFVLATGNVDASERRVKQNRSASIASPAKIVIDRSVCKKIFTKFSLGIIALSIEEADAAPLCK
ncbi:MAG: caspase family protein [Dechloromonas sp.]|uniref:Caspase family protein n=1 Tax=Candidatus Dechloromonas phosphorivorans TaxID=2899244 RepID=A0A935MWE5_9RHOO|nr:caspase family protein [Candidatus Dechloromonas phosphorivorans]